MEYKYSEVSLKLRNKSDIWAMIAQISDLLRSNLDIWAMIAQISDSFLNKQVWNLSDQGWLLKFQTYWEVSQIF